MCSDRSLSFFLSDDDDDQQDVKQHGIGCIGSSVDEDVVGLLFLRLMVADVDVWKSTSADKVSRCTRGSVREVILERDEEDDDDDEEEEAAAPEESV